MAPGWRDQLARADADMDGAHDPGNGEVGDSRTTPGRRRSRVVLVAAAAAVFVADIASKIVASATLDGGPVELPGPVDLRLAYNPGLAFSMAVNAPGWLMLTLTGAVAAAIAVAAWRGTFASALAAGVVVGGAVANVVDRAQAGTVVDMLYTGWWPTFNLADVAVVCGGLALVVTGWRTAPAA